MSIRSDVAVVLTNELFDEVKKEKAINELFFYASYLDSDEEQTLIVLENVKFNLSIRENEFAILLDLIKDRKSDYYVLEVCAEYNQVNEFGELESNFDVGYTFSLSY